MRNLYKFLRSRNLLMLVNQLNILKSLVKEKVQSHLLLTNLQLSTFNQYFRKRRLSLDPIPKKTPFC